MLQYHKRYIMDRRILDSLVAKFAGLTGKLFFIGVGAASIFAGFKPEILVYLLPASGFLIVEKMLLYNSQFINENRLNKLRNKYIKGMTQAANTNVLTPQIKKAIEKYDNLLLDHMARDMVTTQEHIWDVLESKGKYNVIKVDYETLSFEGFPHFRNKETPPYEAKSELVTCYYKDIPSMLQDILKKNIETKVNFKYMKDIELKINYTFSDENEQTLNSTMRFSNGFALKLHDDYFISKFNHLLNSEEEEKKIKYDKLRERLHKQKETESQKQQKKNDKDDFEM